ncbi:hypothetical protein CDAR_467281 [Caerostris darwini]|uniref:Uncharacterized protein n=1 Tax=Caerostris darwini TaxID=1538125 RepID=A0AAV4PA60_9ARAC|nr:hypothetical protein CDAR_467281 [Caerostris darwini]
MTFGSSPKGWGSADEALSHESIRIFWEDMRTYSSSYGLGEETVALLHNRLQPVCSLSRIKEERWIIYGVTGEKIPLPPVTQLI